MGVSVSLDDFGAGYASFNYLSNFHFEKLKLDRSMIVKMATSDSDRAIVAAIAAYARRLDMKIVGEGIETPDQIRHLLENDVSIGQGYYFSRPQPLGSIPWRFAEGAAVA